MSASYRTGLCYNLFDENADENINSFFDVTEHCLLVINICMLMMSPREHEIARHLLYCMALFAWHGRVTLLLAW